MEKRNSRTGWRGGGTRPQFADFRLLFARMSESARNGLVGEASTSSRAVGGNEYETNSGLCLRCYLLRGVLRNILVRNWLSRKYWRAEIDRFGSGGLDADGTGD